MEDFAADLLSCSLRICSTFAADLLSCFVVSLRVYNTLDGREGSADLLEVFRRFKVERSLHS